MVLIAQISDFHCGASLFSQKKLAKAISEVNSLRPDAVIISGDLTNNGFKKEYVMAKKYIDKIKPKTFIIPGNHDTRFVGYTFFDEIFGKGNKVMQFPGIGIVGIDSNIPDLNEGNVGRGKTRWALEQLKQIPHSYLKMVVLHHHLIPIPGTGRERSTVSDAGDVLAEFIGAGVDIILSGHKHTPHSWFINNVAVVNAGSVSSQKLRANIKNSYNIIDINSTHVDIFIKEVGGRRHALAKYKKADSQEFRLACKLC
ncbi:metallophosphoesterase family protein [Nanoarchaeota archaeon]